MLYAVALATAAGLVLAFLSVHTGATFAHPTAFAGFVLFALAVSSFGFPAPHVGYVSLDRVVQFACILIFGALQAAWIIGIAALIWPLLPWGGARDRSLRLTIVRALHNAGMMALVVLATGYLYQYFGGEVPLLQLDARDVLLIILLALFMQLANTLLVAVIARLEDYDWRKVFSPYATMVDLGAIPLAIFTALVYNRSDLREFVLFLIVLALIVVIVRRLADTQRTLENKLNTLVAVSRVGSAVGSAPRIDELLDLIYAEIRRLMNLEIFILGLVNEATGNIDVRLHRNPLGRQPQRSQGLDVGILGWVVAHKRPVFIRSWSKENGEFKRIRHPVNDTPKTQSLIAVPISYREHVLGVLSVQSYTPNRFTDSDLSLLTGFASQVAVALANARLFEELDHSRIELERRVAERTRDLETKTSQSNALAESMRAAKRETERLLAQSQRQTREDELTGLYNRRYLDDRLGQEVIRAQRYRRHLSVVMADIDHFKKVNDEFSHMVGDNVLRTMGNIMRAQCRSIDIIARYGGEEFLLCFPETSRQSAAGVCEKIRQQIAFYDWSKIHPGLAVTMSFGVAAAPPHYDVDTLIAMADEKLYEAKRSGRNRVCA
ncbi:MAG: sensor domain-containing diguanylate cyclase [Gammaproteobacteria bacterium]